MTPTPDRHDFDHRLSRMVDEAREKAERAQADYDIAKARHEDASARLEALVGAQRKIDGNGQKKPTTVVEEHVDPELAKKASEARGKEKAG